MNELADLAAYSQNLCLKDIPENVVSAAKYCILDSIGCAIGAADYEKIPEIVKQVQEFSGEESETSASIWGNNRKTSVFQAILLNGLMGHSLELDDVHTRSKTHIGTVVVPAAWTLAESLKSHGEELLLSVIAGYEVMARIGKGFGVSSHRQKGWHVTGTAGTFGAAAACAKIMKLTEKETLNAFGMAGTQSSGLWAFLEDGASCKILHPARAAVNGFVAALMAKSGMTGPEHILDAKDGGLYQATSDAAAIEEVSKDLGTKYELLEVDKKPYPCCRSTHCAIDAILKISDAHPVSGENIQSILIETYDIGVKQCGSSRYPRTSTEAQFSTPYVVAAALKNSHVTLDQFTQQQIGDSELKHLASKVNVVESDKFTARYPEHWGCSLKVKLSDDTVLVHEVPDASGSVYNPLTEKQSINKFMQLSSAQIGNEKSNNLLSVLLDIQHAESLPSL